MDGNVNPAEAQRLKDIAARSGWCAPPEMVWGPPVDHWLPPVRLSMDADGNVELVPIPEDEWMPLGLHNRAAWEATVAEGMSYRRRISRIRFADEKPWRCPLDGCGGSTARDWQREGDEGKRSWLRFHRCPWCRTIVLPYFFRWVQPSYLRVRAQFFWEDVRR